MCLGQLVLAGAYLLCYLPCFARVCTWSVILGRGNSRSGLSLFSSIGSLFFIQICLACNRQNG